MTGLRLLQYLGTSRSVKAAHSDRSLKYFQITRKEAEAATIDNYLTIAVYFIQGRS